MKVLLLLLAALYIRVFDACDAVFHLFRGVSMTLWGATLFLCVERLRRVTFN